MSLIQDWILRNIDEPFFGQWARYVFLIWSSSVLTIYRTVGVRLCIFFRDNLCIPRIRSSLKPGHHLLWENQLPDSHPSRTHLHGRSHVLETLSGSIVWNDCSLSLRKRFEVLGRSSCVLISGSHTTSHVCWMALFLPGTNTSKTDALYCYCLRLAILFRT